MKEKISKQRELLKKINPMSYDDRMIHLIRLKKALQKYEKDVFAALYEDLRKTPAEAFATEVGLVYGELKHAIKNLKKWMKPHRVPLALMQFPGKTFIHHEPLGQVLIMSPWNYPFLLTMQPIIGALAAGNVLVVKPSSYSPATSKIMKTIVEEAFPDGEVLLFLGGRAVNTEIFTYRYDYIFFTGGATVGKIAMEAAAKNLTPLTLELGGKSPVFITKDADIPLTVRRLSWGKLINCGQTCVAPDYVLLDEAIADTFIPLLKQTFEKDLEEMKKLPKIITTKHYERLKENLNQVGIKRYDDESETILSTIVVNPPLDTLVMSEEIFGPILPIITYKTLDEAIAFVNEREKPLALYVYTTSKEIAKKILNETSSGSMTVNDNLMQLANSNLPFGGVGNSGMGRYHGKKSFETFSNPKSVLVKSRKFDLVIRYSKDDKAIKTFKKLM